MGARTENMVSHVLFTTTVFYFLFFIFTKSTDQHKPTYFDLIEIYKTGPTSVKQQ